MDTIIEFVGLCVFTTQLVSGNVTARIPSQGVPVNRMVDVAIMPRVSNVRAGTAVTPPLESRSPTPVAAATRHPIGYTETPGPTTAPATRRGVVTGFTPMPTNVEAHTAMLAYDPRNQLSIQGWSPKPLHNQGWVYIELSGEKITFVSDAPDGDVNSPSRLPLPHIGHTLTPPFTPQSGYSGAAAVFTIPSGKLTACQQPPLNGAPGRIDTKLNLHTNQQLVITTTSGDKSVTLKAGALVLAGNVPLPYATSLSVTPNAHLHYMVYCAMVGQANCTWPPPPPATSSPSDPMSFCDPRAVYRESGGAQTPLPPQVMADDYACSNTQWP